METILLEWNVNLNKKSLQKIIKNIDYDHIRKKKKKFPPFNAQKDKEAHFLLIYAISRSNYEKNGSLI